jgi:hypothetical protein
MVTFRELNKGNKFGLNQTESNCFIKFVKQKKDLEGLFISNLISFRTESSAREFSTLIRNHQNLKEVDVSNVFNHHNRFKDFNNILMSKSIRKLTMSDSSLGGICFQFWSNGLNNVALN